jgi:hypothetical protein
LPYKIGDLVQAIEPDDTDQIHGHMRHANGSGIAQILEILPYGGYALKLVDNKCCSPDHMAVNRCVGWNDEALKLVSRVTDRWRNLALQTDTSST